MHTSESDPLLAGGTSATSSYLALSRSTTGETSPEEGGIFVYNKPFKAQAEEAGETEEVDDARRQQYEGLPEVKKRLKYIFPALAIGVSPYCSCQHHVLTLLQDLPLRCGPDTRCVKLWRYWQRFAVLEQCFLGCHVVRACASLCNRALLIAASYFLTLTAFQPLYGKLSDIFGRKAALLFAYAIFGLGCVFCGLARNMEELIAARVRPKHTASPLL